MTNYCTVQLSSLVLLTVATEDSLLSIDLVFGVRIGTVFDFVLPIPVSTFILKSLIGTVFFLADLFRPTTSAPTTPALLRDLLETLRSRK
mmetsp:Transcript_26732/g.61520  ORF Transcript_26732/g.61520 Transcript_26732/m.61520 type:complete len:90 (-) Transcript_26732:2324-2593(-)